MIYNPVFSIMYILMFHLLFLILVIGVFFFFLFFFFWWLALLEANQFYWSFQRTNFYFYWFFFLLISSFQILFHGFHGVCYELMTLYLSNLWVSGFPSHRTKKCWWFSSLSKFLLAVRNAGRTSKLLPCGTRNWKPRVFFIVIFVLCC